jgi:hypothetical protein
LRGAGDLRAAVSYMTIVMIDAMMTIIIYHVNHRLAGRGAPS